MFVDAEHSIIVGSPIEIVDIFEKLGSDIVFTADRHAWPDNSLALQYPEVHSSLPPYLSAMAFVGKKESICSLFTAEPEAFNVESLDAMQLALTNLYLKKEIRDKYGMKLDHKNILFQSMYDSASELTVKYLGSHSFLLNTEFDTTPKVVVANGANVELNRLSDYVPDGWSQSAGCQSCQEERKSLADVPPERMPLVLLSIFIEYATPFLPTMLLRLVHLNYPLSRIILCVHNDMEFHKPNVTEFLASSIVAEFHSVEIIQSEKYAVEGDYRNTVIDVCERLKCDYLFALDSNAHIDNPHTLKKLIEQNRPIIAPLLRRPNELWSNFWGSVSASGYYSRSSDYMDIINGVKRGIWNVPCVSSAILFKAEILPKLKNAWHSRQYDADVAFCSSMRTKNLFMFIDNQFHYGHLVNSDYYNTSHYRPELWELNTNRLDWEELYIDNKYWAIGGQDGANDASKYETKCHDVFVFPLVTPQFCRHLIEEMEHYGQWSGGKAYDPRISGGYENVPTVDIHMKQINYHSEWLEILKKYISPLAKFAFTGYEPESRAHMAFVVRYHPKEQDRLRPHFDSSTWTGKFVFF